MVKFRTFLNSREYSRVTEQMAGWCGVKVEFEILIDTCLGGVSHLINERGKDPPSLYLLEDTEYFTDSIEVLRSLDPTDAIKWSN